MWCGRWERLVPPPPKHHDTASGLIRLCLICQSYSFLGQSKASLVITSDGNKQKCPFSSFALHPGQHCFKYVITCSLLVEVVCLTPVESNRGCFPSPGSFLVFGL